MDELDVNNLIGALNNEENAYLLKLNNEKIKTIKNNVLQEIGYQGNELKQLHKKLKCYRFVDELEDVRYGSYIRWINLKNPEKIKLCNGGFITSMNMSNDDIYITCRNNMNRFFRVRMNDAIIFQRNTQQEEILLKVLDYLKM